MPIEWKALWTLGKKKIETFVMRGLGKGMWIKFPQGRQNVKIIMFHINPQQ